MKNLPFGQFVIIPNTLFVDLKSNTITCILNISKDQRFIVDHDAEMQHYSSKIVWRRRVSAIKMSKDISATSPILEQALALLRAAQELSLDLDDRIAHFKRKALLGGHSKNHWMSEVCGNSVYYIKGQEDSRIGSFPTEEDMGF